MGERATGFLWAFGIGLVLTAGCRELPLAEGTLSCSANGRCPAPYTCNPADQRCYRRLPIDAPVETADHGDAAEHSLAVDTADASDAAQDGGSGGTGGGGRPGGDGGDVLIKRGEGLPCSADTDCQSTFCRDGVCCRDACGGPCKACASTYTGGPEGVCANAMLGTSPRGMCADQTSSNGCGQDGTCDGSGQCHRARSGLACGQATCTSTNMFVAPGACDGTGTCVPAAAMSCGVFACAVTGCATPCTGSVDCPSAQYCSANGTCRTRKALGEGCGSGLECGSGICSGDQVCCDKACDGTCTGCLKTQTGQADGTCGFIQLGLDPRDECPTELVSTCGHDGTCDGKGTCHLYPPATLCTPTGTCSGSTFTPAKTCNGGGMCLPTGSPLDCGQSACAADGCKGACSTDADCAATSYCVASTKTCAGRRGNGAACVAGNECTSLACVDFFCCNTGCPGKCSACSAAKTGGANGTCAAVKAGSDPDNECDATDPSSCGQDGSCDGAGQCEKWLNGTQCGAGSCSAGSYSSPRTCSGGVCGTATLSACGAAVCDPAMGCKKTCATNQDCTGNNYCDLVTKQCLPQKVLSAPCAGPTECLLGFCVDGVCCNNLCNGLCSSCKASQTGQPADGTCAFILNGTDPANECAGDGLACGRDGFCGGSGTCRFTPATTPCGTQTCSGSTLTLASRCDGNGGCPPGTPGSCAPFICANMTSCKIACGVDTDCLSSSQFCLSGACVPKEGLGGGCTGSNQCALGFCVDNICCNNACGGVCVSCLGAQTGGSDGTCGNITSGTDPANECAASGTTCGLDGFCGGGRCRFPTAGTTCGAPTCGGSTVVMAAPQCDGAGICAPGQNTACAAGTNCCSATCVDLTSSDANCGTCGHNCQGGGCLNSRCQPKPLATGIVSGPLAIGVDSVYIVDYGNGGRILRVLKASGVATPLPTATGSIFGVATSGNFVYWTTATPGGTNNSVTRAGLDGSLPVVIAPNQVGAASILADGSGVYWVTGNGANTAIMRLGPTDSVPFTFVGMQSRISSIAADANNIYWFTTGSLPDGSDGVVAAQSKALGPLINIASNQPNATGTGMSIATFGGNVYWDPRGLGNTDGVVRSAAAVSSALVTEYANNRERPIGIAADASFVYWVDLGNGTDGMVERASLTTRVVTPIATGLVSPLSIGLEGGVLYFGTQGNSAAGIPGGLYRVIP